MARVAVAVPCDECTGADPWAKGTRPGVAHLVERCETRMRPVAGIEHFLEGEEYFPEGKEVNQYIADPVSKLPEHRPDERRQHLLREKAGCLTAIWLYAAGARRGLAAIKREAASWALERLEAQLSRKHGLIK